MGQGVPSLVRERITADDCTIMLTWHDSVAAELRDAFGPYARWFCRFAPRWLERVVVSYDAQGDGNASLSVTCERSYNRVYLAMQPAWIESDVESRNADIVHELVHAYAAPVNQLWHSVKRHEWQHDENMRKLRQEQYESADEQMTVDLARLLARHLPPAVTP